MEPSVGGAQEKGRQSSLERVGVGILSGTCRKNGGSLEEE